MEDVIQNVASLTHWGKINEIRKHGGCHSKHNTAYMLRKKEMEFVNIEDIIQNTASLTS